MTANFIKSKGWNDAESLGSGWKTLSWIGYFWESGGPWIFHTSLGWLYRYNQEAVASWLYSPDYGWLFSAGQSVPFLYSENLSAWIYAGEKKIYINNQGAWAFL